MRSREEVINYLASKLYAKYFSGINQSYHDVRRLLEVVNFIGYEIRMREVKERFYEILELSKEATQIKEALTSNSNSR